MAYPTNPIYKLSKDGISGEVSSFLKQSGTKTLCIPIAKDNTDYQQYLQDIKENGMSILICDDCGDGVPNDTLWQYLDNAEQLLIDKYGSDQDKLTALREDRYVRAMEAKTPYESMSVAAPIIDATPQEIKDKYRHLPMRR